MTAKIAGFVSRADAGLRAPNHFSRNVTPGNGGVSEHYGGPRQSCAEPGADHSLCVSTWRNWQNFHMNSRGWADVAYTGAFCNHGFAFAGRGAGVRTAANGTNAGNQNYLAVVWLGGEGQTPTQEAFDAADWWIETLRKTGAGLAVKSHNFFRSTRCAGSHISQHAASRDGVRNIGTTAPVATPPARATPDQVRRIQAAVKVTVDGMWGPQTDARVMRMRNAGRARRGWPSNRNVKFNIKDVQEVVGTGVDGIWGPLSQAALTNWVVRFQNVINVKADGLWGPKTDGKLLNLRRRYHNNF